MFPTNSYSHHNAFDIYDNKKFEKMLTRCTKAYSSSCSAV